jgi:two-component system, NarL family, nitrate/nitrite response regulator NarL
MKFTFTKNNQSRTAANEKNLDMKKAVALTKREKEVLAWVAEGLTAQEIASKLFLSLDTVESHRRNIIQKFNARNTVDAVVKAMRIGLIK